ncbi:MAG TPA: TonB-dependent receptor plug domain-containing protein [Opitutus sp.]|nr:TonB-dependent receptor plug domain-containing protein [Opitutus sp.]
MEHIRRINAAFILAVASGASVIGQTVTDNSTVTLEKLEVTALKTFSDQAIPDRTPVSFSELGSDVISAELGSRDIPLILNSTPSVFSTTDSGGAGDARVNVRGFSQRNVSILINGVPTNDIENGWLYWSNWDGLGDVTSTIQVQRGLSNVALPTPSIGGTMNIITDPAKIQRGGSFKLEAGSDAFYKATATLSTGLLADKFALTVGLVKKVGDGYARGTWTEGWAYYLGATWKANASNRLELFAIGAPQRHGQRTFASNIAAYNTGLAKELGYSDAEIAAAIGPGPVNAGNDFNPNYAPVSPSYAGQQYYWGGTHSRYDDNFINERENYFHKPQINLNWYSTISDVLELDSVFYYSGGRGGGSGTLYNTAPVYGFQSSSRAFAFLPNTDAHYGSAYNWDATIAANAGTTTVRGDRTKPAGESLGILRNSVNNQDQYGIISKLNYQLDQANKITTGVDWRTAKIDHFREVRDLLGGTYYVPSDAQVSDFNPDGTNAHLGLGDKVDYYNTNTVDWISLFLTDSYDKGPWTAFATYGYTSIKYSFTDHFVADANGNELYTDAGPIGGNQIKGGVQYAFTEQFRAYVNAGWVSKAPIFDGAIDDITGQVIPNQTNEKFTSFEGGARWASADRKFNVSANVYVTKWRDRTESSVDETANTISFERGVNSDYNGVEFEGAWQPNRMVRFDFAGSYGDWTYVSDVPFETYDISTRQLTSANTTAYINGLRVGDQPQTQLTGAITVFPLHGLSVKLQARWYDRYWADYDPLTRTTASDRAQPWEIPSFSLWDLHLNYHLANIANKFDLSLFVHVFNLLDKTYVSDATDDSQYEAINSAPLHTPQRAEVFLGAPRIWNIGAKISF